MKRRAPLSPWAAARRQWAIETGGAIVAQRFRGTRWDDLAAAYRLTDANAARSLAVGYLLALTEPHEAVQEGAGAAQSPAGVDASPESERGAPSVG